MRTSLSLAALLSAASVAHGCGDSADSCYGPQDAVVHTRHVPRMQPGVPSATTGPTRELEWGTLNFMHTTDTHGWLEGHLKEQNYGADWGDFVSFTKHMREKADQKKVDLLLIDTGDLHDGNGLSDSYTVDGQLSNPIFEKVDYDLLTIGNHELYVSAVAYDTFSNFSRVWGDKYITSNVQIVNPATGNLEYIGKQYRYFTTKHGLRIMAFGVLYNFAGNSNASKVITAANMVQEQWFLDAINTKQPVDLFIITGHNPVRSSSGGTFTTVFNAIRAVHATTPIQIFGGHTHIRDFAVLDSSTTAIESGRYCETLGWVAISGIKSSTYHGSKKCDGSPEPTHHVNATSPIAYARRYLDWNRKTFAFHAVDSQVRKFDEPAGVKVTADITALRTKLNLGAQYGCAPSDYCMSCVPFGAAGSIFPVCQAALATTVINSTRSTVPRYIIANTGSIRFDLYKGPFTFDDSFIVSPFLDGFEYIPNVPYSMASKVLAALNAGPVSRIKRRGSDNTVNTQPFGEMPSPETDLCIDPTLGLMDSKVSSSAADADLKKPRGVIRRSTTLTPGYTTTDDFGTDGDDTVHSKIPYYSIPNYFQANASFPTTTPADDTPIDLIFVDFIDTDVVAALNAMGGKYTIADVSYYLPATGADKFTTQDYLPAYAKVAWGGSGASC